MMRSLVVILLLAAALSGCAENAETPDTTEASDVGAPDDASQQPGASPDAGDVDVPALEVSLLVDAVNGTAPLAVNFTLEGDAPNATWVLDFGDGNGTEGVGLPGEASHIYGPGNFTAILSVAHEGNTTTADALITVVAGGVAPGTLLESTSWADSGTLLAGIQYCDLEEGVDWQNHEWDASALIAQPHAITNLVLTLTETSATAIDLDIDLFGPDGRNLGASHAFNPMAGAGEKVSVSGPLEPGVYTVKVANCSGVQASYDLDIVADLVAV